MKANFNLTPRYALVCIFFASFVQLSSAAAGLSDWLDLTFEMRLASGYLHQGMLINDEPVAQPSLTLEAYGIALSAWGNFDFTKEYSPDAPAFTEATYSIAYSDSVAPFDYSLGFTRNTFPNTPQRFHEESNTLLRRTSSPSHTLYGYLVHPDALLIPSLTAEYTFGWGQSLYLQFALAYEQRLSAELTAALSASLAWATADYHWANYGSDQAALNETALEAAVIWAPLNNLSLKMALNYSYLVSDKIADAAKACGYKAPNAMCSSLSLQYSF